MDSKPMNAHLCSAVWPLRSAVAAGVPLARHCCTRCRLPPSAASSRRQAALSGNSGRANKPRPVLPAARARSARMAAASRSGETCDVCMLSSRHCALKTRWNAGTLCCASVPVKNAVLAEKLTTFCLQWLLAWRLPAYQLAYLCSH